MTLVRTLSDERVTTLARRLASRGASSEMLTAEASAALVAACDGAPEVMTSLLELAFCIAIGDGALKVTLDHVDQALALRADIAAALPIDEGSAAPDADAPKGDFEQAPRDRAIATSEEPALDASDLGSPATAASASMISAARLPSEDENPSSSDALASHAPAWSILAQPDRRKSSPRRSQRLSSVGAASELQRLAPIGAAPGFRPRTVHFAAAGVIVVALAAATYLVQRTSVRGPSGASPAANGQPEEPALAEQVPSAKTIQIPVEPPSTPPPQSTPGPASEAPLTPQIEAPPPPKPLEEGEAREPPAAAVASTPQVDAVPGPAPVAPRVVVPLRVLVEYQPDSQEKQARASKLADLLREKGMSVIAVPDGSRPPPGVNFAFLDDQSGAEAVALALGGAWRARAQPIDPARRWTAEPGLVRLSLP